MSRRSDLECFYQILEELEVKVEGKRLLAHCDGFVKWPKKGLYFFFE